MAVTNNLHQQLRIPEPPEPRTNAAVASDSYLCAMLPPQFVGIVLQLDGLLQQSIVAVPLHKIGAAHEGAVLAGAAVVVPQIEVGEVDGVRERRAGEQCRPCAGRP